MNGQGSWFFDLVWIEARKIRLCRILLGALIEERINQDEITIAVFPPSRHLGGKVAMWIDHHDGAHRSFSGLDTFAVQAQITVDDDFQEFGLAAFGFA